MGVWLIAKGELDLNPKLDEEIIKEFVNFSEQTCPEGYGEEKFGNVWFFNQQNKLLCCGGKFAEPSIWYEHMEKNFFKPRGYQLIGNVEILGECDEGYQELLEANTREYQKWLVRKNSFRK